MIDFHSHILPAFDDGAVTVDESIVIAQALADFGYKSVFCTPHCIKGSYELTPQKVREATLMLQADLDNAEIDLELLPGMEYMLDENFAAFADDLLPLGSTKLILCEAPQEADHRFVQEGLELIIAKGFVPLIAHPERTQYFYEKLISGNEQEASSPEFGNVSHKPEKPKSFLKRLFTSRSSSTNSKSTIQNSKMSDEEFPSGVLFHANLGSFTGYYGEDVQRCAYDLLKQGVYTALASDLHDGASAAKVLVQSKFETNPLLKKLAEWDGTVQPSGDIENSGAGQGELF